MGYAPADNPDIAIYVVVDRCNVQYQDDAKFATRIVRAVLTEALPYLNYPMTEELSEKEQAELAELREQMVTTAEPVVEGEETEELSQEEATEEETQTEEETTASEDGRSIWESFDVDSATGYYIDPNTGNLIDPESGHEFGGDDLPDFGSDSIFEPVQDGNGN